MVRLQIALLIDFIIAEMLQSWQETTKQLCAKKAYKWKYIEWVHKNQLQKTYKNL